MEAPAGGVSGDNNLRRSSDDERTAEDTWLLRRSTAAAAATPPSVDSLVEAVGLGLWNARVVGILGLGNAADAIELMCIGYIIPELPELDDANVKPAYVAWRKGCLAAAIFVGMLAGGVVCGVQADKIGRRPCLLLSLGLTSSFGLLSSIMSGWQGIALCRMISGFGVGGAVPSVFTLGIEVVPKARRGLTQSLIAANWMVGTVFTAALAWFLLGSSHDGPAAADDSLPTTTQGGIAAWRVFAALAALPSALTFLLVLVYVPESPRFLFSQGRAAEGLQILNHGCALNGAPGLNADARDFQTASGAKAASTVKENLAELLRPPLRKTTLLLMGVWAAINFGWYGLLLWLPSLFERAGLQQSMYKDALLTALANLPGNIITAIVIDRVGRKPLLAAALVLAAAVSVAMAFAHGPTQIVVAACAFNFVSVAAWNALDCISVESFPTAQRGSAMAFLAATGRAGSTVAQFVNGLLIEASVFALLLCCGAAMLLAAILTMALPVETSGVALDDVAAETLAGKSKGGAQRSRANAAADGVGEQDSEGSDRHAGP